MSRVAAVGEAAREVFGSRLGVLATMVGVAVGLGNVWRFPYMVGRYGGSGFVLLYLGWAVVVGVPALVCEWTLGRRTRRGSVGAYERAGVPGGRTLGWLFFAGVAAATAYYVDAVGWVLHHAFAQAARLLGATVDAAAVLPPETGLDATSLLLQSIWSGAIVLGSALVLVKGLRRGIERVSRVVTPFLFLALLVLVLRSLTLPGAGEGVRWLLGRIEPGGWTASVAVAALGQSVFSLALGGTFMVVYGSYLDDGEPLAGNAGWTVAGDTAAGLLAGLAIFPAVLALGLEPASGPGLVFATLPEVFGRMPAGAAFGTLFFVALGAVAWLSVVAALEVLVAGITDNTPLSRPAATWTVATVVLLLAVPPMLNMAVFVPWDLTFGSGFQTAGALAAVLTVGWSLDRGRALAELAREGGRVAPLLVLWVRFGVPAAITGVGLWWLLGDVLGRLEAA